MKFSHLIACLTACFSLQTLSADYTIIDPYSGETITYYMPLHQHWIDQLDGSGEWITFGDGSQWKVATNNTWVSSEWRPGDILKVSQNTSCCSLYQYYITKLTFVNGKEYTHSFVQANLYTGPEAYGNYSHWIVAIDHAAGQLFLENGTSWTIPRADLDTFQEWAVNDHLIIGVNDGWFSSYASCLINVNMNTTLRAQRF
jgi:hypothetical protein